MNNRVLTSWSGGKDSCYAAMQAKAQGYEPTVLLNVLNEAGQISRSHGIPLAILQAQAAAAGLPLHAISSSWAGYETKFTAALVHIKEMYHVSHAVFGDIDLQAHRDWEEKVCANAGLTAVLPIWQQNRKQLLYNMLDSGIETMIVSCNSVMGPAFLGRVLTRSIIPELEALGVDVCGENGEFHTLVLNCPLFSNALQVKLRATMQHEHYWFSELELEG